MKTSRAVSLRLLSLLLWTLPDTVHGTTVVAAKKSDRRVRPVVVLVHGCWNDGRIFGPMVRVLERQGYPCFAPDLTPNDGRLGIRQLTEELAGKIDARCGPDAPVVLIGFSMGGLIARDYVEHVAAAPRRVRGVFLISSGGEGTLWANLSPRSGQRDMAVGSAFLQTLNADDAPWKTIPLHAYWTPFDLMVVPAVNSRWATDGRSTRVLCPVHPWMARNRRVITDIAARLQKISPAAGS